jgi:hypothetical protein
VALRPAMVQGVVRTSGKQTQDGGPSEEHCGVWCHGGLRVAATSCEAGLATSPWWIGFYD